MWAAPFPGQVILDCMKILDIHEPVSESSDRIPQNSSLVSTVLLDYESVSWLEALFHGMGGRLVFGFLPSVPVMTFLNDVLQPG